MDLDLSEVIEIKEIRKLISHKKNLLEFFDELIKIRNLRINDYPVGDDLESETDSDYSCDSDDSDFSSD